MKALQSHNALYYTLQLAATAQITGMPKSQLYCPRLILTQTRGPGRWWVKQLGTHSSRGTELSAPTFTLVLPCILQALGEYTSTYRIDLYAICSCLKEVNTEDPTSPVLPYFSKIIIYKTNIYTFSPFSVFCFFDETFFFAVTISCLVSGWGGNTSCFFEGAMIASTFFSWSSSANKNGNNHHSKPWTQHKTCN